MIPSFNQMKDEALSKLSGKWGEAVLAIFLYFLITIIASMVPFLGTIVGIFIAGPFALGLAIFFLRLVRNESVSVNNIFDGFKLNFGNAIIASILIAIIQFVFILPALVFFIISLLYFYGGSIENFRLNVINSAPMLLILFVLLLIISFVFVIIAAIAMSQTYRIMADNPQIGPINAIKKSHEMMKGHRLEFFLLNLSFIGWAFLCLLTLGFGFLVLMPYVMSTNSIYYNHLSNYSNNELNQLGSDLQEISKY